MLSSAILITGSSYMLSVMTVFSQLLCYSLQSCKHLFLNLSVQGCWF